MNDKVYGETSFVKYLTTLGETEYLKQYSSLSPLQRQTIVNEWLSSGGLQALWDMVVPPTPVPIVTKSDCDHCHRGNLSYQSESTTVHGAWYKCDVCGDVVLKTNEVKDIDINILIDNYSGLFVTYLESHGLTSSVTKFRSLPWEVKRDVLTLWKTDFVTLTSDGKYIGYNERPYAKVLAV